MVTQKILEPSQLEAFYHDNFVEDQVRDFLSAFGTARQGEGRVADIGGSVGHFARAIESVSEWRVRVLDLDPASIEACHAAGLEACLSDALDPLIKGDERIASFNLILHHLVADGMADTRLLQVKALRAWHGRAERVFVNEYIYESPLVAGLSAALIYQVTASRTLSTVAAMLSRLVPSLRANTFGVGVRFRPVAEWAALFDEAGYTVAAHMRGPEEPVSLARRALFIASCRRDSFVLVPKITKEAA